MIRIIVRATNCGAAANVGGPVETQYKTIDWDIPELERLLKQAKETTYAYAEVIGVEVLNY